MRRLLSEKIYGERVSSWILHLTGGGIIGVFLGNIIWELIQ